MYMRGAADRSSLIKIKGNTKDFTKVLVVAVLDRRTHMEVGPAEPGKLSRVPRLRVDPLRTQCHRSRVRRGAGANRGRPLGDRAACAEWRWRTRVGSTASVAGTSGPAAATRRPATHTLATTRWRSTWRRTSCRRRWGVSCACGVIRHQQPLPAPALSPAHLDTFLARGTLALFACTLTLTLFGCTLTLALVRRRRGL